MAIDIRDLKEKTVVELRKIAKSVNISGKTGLKIAGAKKETLIEAISNGIWPKINQNNLTQEPSVSFKSIEQVNNEQHNIVESKIKSRLDLSMILADAIKDHLNLDELQPKQEVTEEQIKNWIIEARDSFMTEEKLKNWINAITPKPTKVEVVKPSGDIKKMGLQHKIFPELVKLAGIREHVWMTGPAGGGKTTAAKNVAEALEIPFYPMSVCKQTTVYQMMGYLNQNGEYIESDVYKAYTKGGLLLVDEVDGGNANVTMGLNAVLSSDVANFPCGVVEKHPDFVCFAGANTMGHGATREYIGRNPLDAAFLNRFGAKILFEYDEEMEKALTDNQQWALYVQACREAASDLGIKVVISPRATISGAKMLANGFSDREVKDMVLWNEMGPENAKRISEKVREEF